MSSALVRLILNGWARLTLCPCRTMPYLDHRTRTVHIRNNTP